MDETTLVLNLYQFSSLDLRPLRCKIVRNNVFVCFWNLIRTKPNLKYISSLSNPESINCVVKFLSCLGLLKFLITEDPFEMHIYRALVEPQFQMSCSYECCRF